MFRLATTAVIAASLVGTFVVHAGARGRSFPIEVTGTITMFNKAIHMFTIHVDDPSRILTIAVGRDCKFKHSGRATTEQILKQGARVKVRYFSTIFTGNIAVEIEVNSLPE
jgi:DUF917 family protein